MAQSFSRSNQFGESTYFWNNNQWCLSQSKSACSHCHGKNHRRIEEQYVLFCCVWFDCFFDFSMKKSPFVVPFQKWIFYIVLSVCWYVCVWFQIIWLFINLIVFTCLLVGKSWIRRDWFLFLGNNKLKF